MLLAFGVAVAGLLLLKFVTLLLGVVIVVIIALPPSASASALDRRGIPRGLGCDRGPIVASVPSSHMRCQLGQAREPEEVDHIWTCLTRATLRTTGPPPRTWTPRSLRRIWSAVLSTGPVSPAGGRC